MKSKIDEMKIAKRKRRKVNCRTRKHERNEVEGKGRRENNVKGRLGEIQEGEKRRRKKGEKTNYWAK